MVLYLGLLAGLCAGGPVESTSNAIQVGLVHPWAYGVGTLEAIQYTCNHPRRRSMTVVSSGVITSSPAGSHSSIWVSAYAIIAEARFYDPAILYLIVQPASTDHYNLTVCETMPTPTVANEWGNTELYADCGPAVTLSPTHTPTAYPTNIPTSLPTASPTAAAEFNPMTETECTDNGGTAWHEEYVSVDDLTVVARYCCDHPVCNETLEIYQVGLDGCACPAVAGETPVRDNTGICYYCVVEGAVSMTYCAGDTPGCNTTYTCPSGLFSNACVAWYTTIPVASPTVSPTAVPTAAPSYALSVPNRPCWTFNATTETDYGPMSQAECESEGGSDWATVTAGTVVAVRFCCGHPLCDEFFLDTEQSLLACACPASPTEPSVRNNTGDCQ